MIVALVTGALLACGLIRSAVGLNRSAMSRLAVCVPKSRGSGPVQSAQKRILLLCTLVLQNKTLENWKIYIIFGRIEAVLLLVLILYTVADRHSTLLLIVGRVVSSQIILHVEKNVSGTVVQEPIFREKRIAPIYLTLYLLNKSSLQWCAHYVKFLHQKTLHSCS